MKICLLFPIVIVLFTAGCGVTKPYKVNGSRVVGRSIEVSPNVTTTREIFVDSEIKGITGWLKARTLIETWRVDHVEPVSTTKRRSITPAGLFVAAAGVALSAGGVLISEPNNVVDVLYGGTTVVSSEATGPVKKVRRTKIKSEPLPFAPVHLSIPEVGMSHVMTTDLNGEVDFHLLEAVAQNRGTTPITVSLRLDSGAKKVIRIPHAECARMFEFYQKMLRIQEDHESVTVSGLSKQEFLALAQKAKEGYDAYSNAKLAYDNYKLVRTGMTISRAFRITLPSFVIGLAVEEVVWHFIEVSLSEAD